MKINKKITLLVLFLIFFFPFFVLAQGEIPPEIIEWIDFIRNIALVSATLMIVIGGFQWLTSAGDPTKIASAKDRIYSAILGLLILACLEVILRIFI